jgi:hypothetical protein
VKTNSRPSVVGKSTSRSCMAMGFSRTTRGKRRSSSSSKGGSTQNTCSPSKRPFGVPTRYCAPRARINSRCASVGIDPRSLTQLRYRSNSIARNIGPGGGTPFLSAARSRQSTRMPGSPRGSASGKLTLSPMRWFAPPQHLGQAHLHPCAGAPRVVSGGTRLQGLASSY